MRSASRSRSRESIESRFDEHPEALGYFYFEDKPGRRSAAKLLTKDEARCTAVNFAKLPLRLSKPSAHRGEPVYDLVHHTG